jgi:multiple sugar transport system substrate-binding protein
MDHRNRLCTAKKGRCRRRLKSFLAENEMMKAAIEQMDGVVSWTSFPGDAGLQAEQMLLDMRDQIFGGQVTAEEGMTSTQDAINALLDAQ